MYADTSSTPFAYIEAAYSALQAAVIFYQGLRSRSQIDESTLSELEHIKRTIRLAMSNDRYSQASLRAMVDNILGSLRQLTSALRGSSPGTTILYAERGYLSNDIGEQVVQYLNNARRWLEAAKSASDCNNGQTGEGASNNSRTSVTQQNQAIDDTQYYATGCYCRL